jgi:hypothetical protein
LFVHEKIIDVSTIKKEDTPEGRFYLTPEGNRYPSVTTVLGKAGDSSYLDAWKKRIGEEAASGISRQATRRGTAVHDLLEKYLYNDPHYKKGHMPANIASFNYLKPYLDDHISMIGGLEVPLWSDFLRVAGSVDCVAKWNNQWSIVDFKTSKRQKSRDQIHNYFMQAACYSYMVYEQSGIVPMQLVILMTVDDCEPQVFIERADEWLPKFIDLRKTVFL